MGNIRVVEKWKGKDHCHSPFSIELVRLSGQGMELVDQTTSLSILGVRIRNEKNRPFRSLYLSVFEPSENHQQDGNCRGNNSALTDIAFLAVTGYFSEQE